MASAPAALVARTGDGKAQTIVALGAGLPASGRLVFATERAGQDALELELYEGETLLAKARFPLPRGLPANCWIPVDVSVGPDLTVRAEARENLRRIDVRAEFEPGEGAEHYRV